MDFNANISVSETDFETYIGNIIDERIDYDHLATEVTTHINFDEMKDELKEEISESVHNSVVETLDITNDIENWMSYNFDIESHLRNIDLDDYVDLAIIDNKAEELLNNYAPSYTCSLGSAFTAAVEKAFRYLCLTNDDFAEDIQRALDKAKKRIFEKKIIEEQKNYWIQIATPDIIHNYNLQLNEYFKELEIQKAKELLGSNTAEAPIIPLNNLNNNIA